MKHANFPKAFRSAIPYVIRSSCANIQVAMSSEQPHWLRNDGLMATYDTEIVDCK